MLNAIHYYWITTKGYRLHPWDSPYVQWRMETFFGEEAGEMDRKKFMGLMWRERKRMWDFLGWVKERRRAQRMKRRKFGW